MCIRDRCRTRGGGASLMNQQSIASTRVCASMETAGALDSQDRACETKPPSGGFTARSGEFAGRAVNSQLDRANSHRSRATSHFTLQTSNKGSNK
eukprot:8747401-Pyramimonas_sp.AAC.1